MAHSVHGWQELRNLDFAVPEMPPIRRRLVALADVPDVALLPDRLPGRPATTFRAGTELGFQNRALWLASWPVRWGWLRSLSGLSRGLKPLQRLTANMGSARSAMIISLYGDRGGERIERRWTLIADQGDGPEIPALSVPLVVERILARQEAPGARDAGLALTLADYEPLFASLAIRHAQEDIAAPGPLYRRVMGSRFSDLPAAVRTLHDVWRDGGAEGEAEVIGPTNRLAAFVARAVGFPPPGRCTVHVRFEERDGVETWMRSFGDHRFSSQLSQSGQCLVERFGPLRFRFDLPNAGNGLAMIMRRWSFLGVPLPLALAPRSPGTSAGCPKNCVAR